MNYFKPNIKKRESPSIKSSLIPRMSRRMVTSYIVYAYGWRTQEQQNYVTLFYYVCVEGPHGVYRVFHWLWSLEICEWRKGDSRHTIHIKHYPDQFYVALSDWYLYLSLVNFAPFHLFLVFLNTIQL